MRLTLWLALLLLVLGVLQAALLPALLPPAWRPDLGLLAGLAALAFLKPEAAVVWIFALGVQSDVLGSERLGLLTFGYLAAAWVLLSNQGALQRGGVRAAWAGAVLGTALAHGTYVLLGQLAGISSELQDGLLAAGARTAAAVLWGAPVAWVLGACLARLELLAPEAREVRARRPRRRGWWRTWRYSS